MENNNLPKVAYFCMEYGLDSNFKIYAGGLGVLAGDYMKAAKNNGYPVVGIGLLWKENYTQQFINNEGQPYDIFPEYNYDYLADTGVKVDVRIKDKEITAKVWKVDVFDNAPLFLLDTDIEENDNFVINDQLYAGFSDKRIPREMLLGIGGIRALKELGIEIDVYHFNEGHAMFAGIELIRDKMYNNNKTFKEAWEETKKQIVFTTHTPVLAGNEEHDLNMLWDKGAFNWLTHDQMIKIGDSPFNMTVAGLRLASISNAVSELHCRTANKMWENVQGKSEIIAITNGVDKRTWMDNRILEAYEDNGDILETHQILKEEMLDFIQDKTNIRLNKDAIIIGYARRATEYKRMNLVFQKIEDLREKLLENKIQFVFSGKAHPYDEQGKQNISNIVRLAKEFPQSIVFLENYDMNIAKKMITGCDVWLNTPRRPNEASGTSGIKAAMNGVLNLSTLDGWWPEICEHGVNGWQFGDGLEFFNIDEQDKHDLDALYNVLTKEVLTVYYNNKDKWKEMMINSIKSVYKDFTSDRMINDYYTKLYTNDKVKEAAMNL